MPHFRENRVWKFIKYKCRQFLTKHIWSLFSWFFKMLLHISCLFLRVEYPRVDYLSMSSIESTKFEYTWLKFSNSILLKIKMFDSFLHAGSPFTWLRDTLYNISPLKIMRKNIHVVSQRISNSTLEKREKRGRLEVSVLLWFSSHIVKIHCFRLNPPLRVWKFCLSLLPRVEIGLWVCPWDFVRILLRRRSLL